MNFPHEFLSAVALSDVCTSYYGLCQMHPLRTGAPKVQAPAKEVIKAAAGRVALTKLGGPGSAYLLGGLPAGTSLAFILQGRCTVETDFTVLFRGVQQRGTFSILCKDASAYGGQVLANPPYPRPNFYALEELLDIFYELDVLVRKIASVANGNH
jgi:hypothetical protein